MLGPFQWTEIVNSGTINLKEKEINVAGMEKIIHS